MKEKLKKNFDKKILKKELNVFKKKKRLLQNITK